MKTTIKQFFHYKQLLNYEDILKYYEFNVGEYKLREIVSNTYWRVEALIDIFSKNKSVKLIFNEDVVSPHRDYNHIQAQSLIDKLDEQYNDIMKTFFN